MMEDLWNDDIGVMNAVFGEATSIEAIKWIETTADNALEYHNDCYFDRIDLTINRIMLKETGTRNWDDNDAKNLSKKWAYTIIKMGFSGIHNPQMAFLVSDLVYWPGAFELGVKKHGEDIVADIINTLMEKKAGVMENLTDILLADNPFDMVGEISGVGYDFITEESWLEKHKEHKVF